MKTTSKARKGKPEFLGVEEGIESQSVGVRADTSWALESDWWILTRKWIRLVRRLVFPHRDRLAEKEAALSISETGTWELETPYPL